MPKELFRIGFSQPRMSADNAEAEVMLYGEIIADMDDYFKWSQQDKSAADFDKAVKQAKDAGARKLKLRVNSPGGLVSEAVAMRSILSDAAFDEINIRIEGLCASAATLIASVPGAHVSIAPGSEYMIHNPWSIAMGSAVDFEHAAEHLRALEKNARDMYRKRTGAEDEQIKSWMDAETWFSAEDAVKNGFCDEVADDGITQAAACASVSGREMAVMRALYAHTPEHLAVREEPQGGAQGGAQGGTTDSHADKPATEYKTPNEEGQNMAETMTLEQLRAENPELFASIAQNGAAMERQRIQDINDLTAPGYESMAQQAIADGMSAMDFHKAVIKAQREKGGAFLDARKKETDPAEQVKGGASEDNDASDEARMAAEAKEIAALAAQMNSGNETMY